MERFDEWKLQSLTNIQTKWKSKQISSEIMDIMTYTLFDLEEEEKVIYQMITNVALLL